MLAITPVDYSTTKPHIARVQNQHYLDPQVQIEFKQARLQEERQREQEQDALAKQRAAEYEAKMRAHLLQAPLLADRNFGYKKSQFF